MHTCNALIRKTLYGLMAIALVLSSLGGSKVAGVRAQTNDGNPATAVPAYVPGVVLIGLKPGASLETNSNTGKAFTTNSSGLGASLQALQVSNVEHLFSLSQADQTRITSAGEADLSEYYRVNLPADADVLSAIEQLSNDPEVAFAEPDYIARIADDATPTDPETATPSDVPTPTATDTPTDTLSPTDTETPADTLTPSATPTDTSTPTDTITPSETSTDTLTPTDTVTPSATPTLMATSTSTLISAASVNDPLYPDQWGMSKIQIEGAWSQTMGSPQIIIAVLDSGIDLSHPDLAAHLWVNPGEIAGNGLDDDNNGYVDDVDGWNFVAGSNDVSDDNGHGTLVAGVAAAIAGNGLGIAGVCPQCTILPVKVMQASGVANYSDIAAGILYAAQKGARVINLSLGGYANSNTLNNAINVAVNTYGAVVVAGAGNDNLNQAFYPAAYDNVLAVAGTASDDTKLDFSNYGAWVDVSAPAKDIRTTALGEDWANASGTSVGAPFASGLVGLLWSLHPDWNQATIRSQIVHTTDGIDSLNPTFAGLLGSGRLNASAAVQPPHPLISMGGYTVNGQASGRLVLGATASLTVTLQNDWWDAAGVTGTLSTTDPYISMVNASVDYGDIPAGTSLTDATAFSFTVDSAAGYNYSIPFTLQINETTGYTNSFDFTVNTETGVVNKSGSLITQTWTNDKTYLITNNISVPTGNTLTIQPGTVVKFNGNYALSVRGTLVADGTAAQPIVFQSNTSGTSWDKLFFDDLSVDAQADGSGSYLSGSILRYVSIQGNTGGVTCTTSTPYLSHVTLSNGGITCTLGATPVWFMDNTITGNASFTGLGNAYRNTITGVLSITGAGTAQDNILNGGGLSLGSGTALRNSISGGGLSVGGTGGSIANNTVSGGNVSAGSTFSVTYNTITGSLTAGNSVTVDHNTVSNGITVGSSATVTWNNVENYAGTGLSAGTNVSAQYNRLIGDASGMIASTGLIEHNIIANNSGVGLQVGAATVSYNSFTGNQGNTVLVQGGNPLTIAYNNLEGNTGTYDLYLNIPGSAFVMAQHNWWGTTDNLAIANRIYDWNDDDTKATASYTLKLSAPDQTSPGYVRSVTVSPDTTLGIQTGTFQTQFSKPMDVTNSPQLSFVRSVGVTWATRASMPTARTALGLAASSNGKIYAIGGSGLSGILFNAVEEYDPATNTWATRTSIPTARNGFGVAVTSNGKIYVIGGGGQGGVDISTLEAYDPATDTWATRASMPTARSALGAAAATNGKIYAIGGRYGGSYLSTVEEYDPTTNTWATRASMPTSLWSPGVVSSSNGKVYVIGGLNSNYVSTVYEYDPATDTWAIRASMPTARNLFGIAIASNGKIYAIGGTNGSILSTVEEYNPATDVWTTCANMPTPRWGLGAATASNGKIYAVGGWSTYYNFYSTVEEATIPIQMNDFYNPQWPTGTQFQANYDITSLIPKDTYRVNVSDALDPDGMRVAPYSNATFNVDYAGFISDTTPPIKPVVTAGGVGSLTSLSASWSSSDPESSISNYRYAIGTTPGAQEVVSWTYLSGTTTSMTRSGLNLTLGQNYYVTVGARNAGGLWSDNGVSNAVAAGVVYTISGSTRVAGATLNYTDGTAKTATSAADGSYSFSVSPNWAGTVSVSKAGYTFAPASRTYSNILSNQTGQNYIAVKVRDDYDGDGKSDPVKFDPASGIAWWLKSSTGTWDGLWMGSDTFQYVSGSDFDGDGKTDPAKFYSAAGVVWWSKSTTGTLDGQWLAPDLFTYITGSDFDGDGKADPAKFYPETGTVWWVKSTTGTLGGQWLGADSFQYISGSDFDGDGKADPAKFYPATGTVWWVRSSDGTMDGMWLGPDAFNYVQASDFDGDGKTDPAKFYPSTGTLWWVRSSDGVMDGAWLGPGTYTVIAGDDFNGDGKTDPAKYDASTHTLSWLDTTTGTWTNVDMGTGTYDVVNGQQ